MGETTSYNVLKPGQGLQETLTSVIGNQVFWGIFVYNQILIFCPILGINDFKIKQFEFLDFFFILYFTSVPMINMTDLFINL